MDHKQKWQWFAPAGLTVIGLGLSLLGEAIGKKQRGEAWFWPGTLSLICVNAGIALFGEAVKARVRHELTE